MGFLKFLKRKPKAEGGFEDLDLPPPPPHLEHEDMDGGLMGSGMLKGDKGDLLKDDLQFPHPDDFKDDFSLPDDTEFSEHELSLPPEPNLDEPKLLPPPKVVIPSKNKVEMPKLPEMPKFAAHNIPPAQPMPHPRDIPQPVAPHKSSLPPKVNYIPPLMKQSGKHLYVHLDGFKNTLRTISSIRADVREAEKVYHSFNESKSEADKAINSFHPIVHDIQRKLASIDKKLFKEVS